MLRCWKGKKKNEEEWDWREKGGRVKTNKEGREKDKVKISVEERINHNGRVAILWVCDQDLQRKVWRLIWIHWSNYKEEEAEKQEQGREEEEKEEE